MNLLKIKNLEIKIKNKTIINNLNLNIKKGEIHILKGCNGSGKSTLCLTIAGYKHVIINKGNIIYNNKIINNLSIEKRAHMGLFISFQENIEIPGLNNQLFLYQSLNSIRIAKKKKKISFIQFKKLLFKKIKILNFPKELLKKDLNVKFSGGEKKKNEILQILLLNPKLIILDEIDSSLDKKTFKILIYIIKKLTKKKKSFLIITHNIKFIKNINPKYIHTIKNGKINTIKI